MRYVAVGTDQAVSALIGPKTRTIDLHGKLVLPGIVDAHTHPAESSQDLGKCNLKDQTLTPAQIRSKLAECLKEEPAEHPPWFEVVQVNSSNLTLTRQDLDSMLSERPMVLEDTSGHTIWANTAALAAAGHRRQHQESRRRAHRARCRGQSDRHATRRGGGDRVGR